MLVKDKISTQRKSLGISVVQLGKITGINQGSISRYENGYVKVIPKDALLRISDALQIPFEDLIAEDPKYTFMSEKPRQHDPSELSLEDMQLLSWFHGLPTEIQDIVKQFWTVSVST